MTSRVPLLWAVIALATMLLLACGEPSPPVERPTPSATRLSSESIPVIGKGKVFAGSVNTCVIKGEGRLWCWGGNFQGQLGRGHKDFIGDDPSEMGGYLRSVDLGMGQRVVQAAIGSRHVCAVLDDGAVKCWGFNEFGQLGQGHREDIGDDIREMGSNLPPVSLGTGRRAVQVAAGDDHTCALLDDGTVKCWGRNNRGQLGLGRKGDVGGAPGEMGDALPRADLGAGHRATQISARGDQTCALLDEGMVKCWGVSISRESFKKISIGDVPDEMGDNLPFIQLGEGRFALHLSTGDLHACALLDDGTARCWGQPDIREHTRMEGGRSFTQVSSGRAFSCGLIDDGSVTCWGENEQGQLGLGHTAPVIDSSDIPLIDLGAGRKALEIIAGGDHSCAVLDDGTLKCWGDNSRGQLGLGHRENIGDEPGEMGDSLPPVGLSAG